MKDNKNYRSKGDLFFIDYLPDEVFYNLNESDRESYRLYRNNHRYIHDGTEKVKKIELQIQKLKEEIKSIKGKIKGDDNSDGWKSLMKKNYSDINQLSKKFEFYCSVGFRKRTSVSVKNKTKFNKELLRTQTHYDGKELKVNEKLYVRIDSSDKRHLKNIYVGDETDVRNMVERLREGDWSSGKVTQNRLKLEIRDIYVSYSRYKIYHSDWESFKRETHSISSIEEWVKEIGDKFQEWR